LVEGVVFLWYIHQSFLDEFTGFGVSYILRRDKNFLRLDYPTWGLIRKWL
jgi:hypothetical protein